ncbi:hypothetical protein HS088_TW14G00468 [Tripterygium wilfordii]|uniref:Uncharacterized protein n=1 Tax=Tripterygium wilfordii TaxID=458696 RepID=A0A7J7CQP8_TRIWF|nr:hypothetical protein HS088_TW14G00468 [Tripterygium wilfordii]
MPSLWRVPTMHYFSAYFLPKYCIGATFLGDFVNISLGPAMAIGFKLQLQLQLKTPIAQAKTNDAPTAPLRILPPPLSSKEGLADLSTARITRHTGFGDFSKAPDYKCLKEKNMSDGRRPLYKAILYVMRKDKDEDEDLEEAKKYWKEFKELRTNYYWPPGMQEDKLYKVITDFEEFKEVVEVLKKDIKEVHKQGTNKV